MEGRYCVAEYENPKFGIMGLLYGNEEAFSVVFWLLLSSLVSFPGENWD